MRRRILLETAAVAGFLGVSLCGCALGPAALRATRMPYNEVIQRTTREQLLLNLVRLQYREAPLFLEVGNIAAQFTFTESGSISGTLNENVGLEPSNPDVLQLGGGIGLEERPTITFAPLAGEEFAKRLMSPVTLETIVTLSRSGWSIDRVLRLTVQGMNGLGNASQASGPTPDEAPSYQQFARATRLLRDLQWGGLLQLGYESQPVQLSEPIAADAVTPADMLAAAKEGYRFGATEDGRLVLTGSSQKLVWRIPPVASDMPQVRELVELLGLVPDQLCYEVRATTGEGLPASLTGQRTSIDVAPRSLLGTLFYLSQAIEVPAKHRERGFVSTTLDAEGKPFNWTRVTGDLLRVHSRKTRPRNVAVAVRYKGYWYYVDNSDLPSKSTFTLLGQLFAFQAGGEVSAAPVLTLPVGG